MKKITFLILFILISSLLLAHEANDILGKWKTANGKSIVQIYSDGKTYFGKIIWLKDPIYPKGDQYEGKPKMDIHNPEKSKRNNELIGLKLLWGFKFKNNRWIGGRIYDPENGKTYYCKIHLDKDNNLIIKGSIDKWGMIGRSTKWKRVSETNESSGK